MRGILHRKQFYRENFRDAKPRCRPGLSQAWLRRFNFAFALRSGCKHCSDAAVS
jgi:hypothetical protein